MRVVCMSFSVPALVLPMQSRGRSAPGWNSMHCAGMPCLLAQTIASSGPVQSAQVETRRRRGKKTPHLSTLNERPGSIPGCTKEQAVQTACAGLQVGRHREAGIAVVRPAGHRQQSNTTGGFCVSNNTAATTRATLLKTQKPPVVLLCA